MYVPKKTGEAIQVIGNSPGCKHFVEIGAVGNVIKFGSMGDRARVEFSEIRQWIKFVDMKPYESPDDSESAGWDD